MSYAEGSSRYIAIAKEAVDGTPETALVKLRNTGGDGISNERSAIESAEIRNDRGISDVRLGNNQPNASVPFELSYEAFDTVFEATTGQPFKGGAKVTLDVDFIATGGYIDTQDASTWASHGVYAGDTIVISNAVDAGNNGAFYVSAITNDRATLLELDKTTGATITDETTDNVTINTCRNAGQINAATNNVTVNATAKTITFASTVASLGFEVGMNVFFAGFAQSGNNGWKKITSKTSTVLTFSGATLTNETLSTGLLDYAQYVGVMQTNIVNDLPSVTIEEGFTDIGQYHYTAGAKVETLSLSCQPDAMITGEVAFSGRLYSGFSASPLGTVASASTNSPFDSYTGNIVVDDLTEADSVITGLDFEIANNTERRFGVMQVNAAAIGEGRVGITGTMTASFTNADLCSAYEAETEIPVKLNPKDLNDNYYSFYMPRCKIKTCTRSISENDVSLSMEFQALMSNTLGYTLQISKIPTAI